LGLPLVPAGSAACDHTFQRRWLADLGSYQSDWL